MLIRLYRRCSRHPHRSRANAGRAIVYGWIGFCLLLLAGCGSNMQHQLHYYPWEPSSFFKDGTSARPLEADTVVRGDPRSDTQFYTGKVNDKLVDTLPFPVTAAVLQRGQERFNIYCAPCHGLLGDGNGIIVQRGFTQPPSFHTDTLRNAPIGLYYDVITNGYGAMYSYAARVAPEDRWAIAAYIRALQLSQHATLQDVPLDQQTRLQEVKP